MLKVVITESVFVVYCWSSFEDFLTQVYKMHQWKSQLLVCTFAAFLRPLTVPRQSGSCSYMSVICVY